jgi:esterase/lipase superfamily enzyme
MKKRLVLTLATSAILILAGCGGTPASSASVSSTPVVTSSTPVTTSSQPATSVPASTSSEVAITAMSITNKDALKATWHVADADRQVSFSTTPEANIAQLILDGRLVIASSDATVVSVNGQYLTALKEGTATITATIGTLTDSVDLTVLASEKDYALTPLADVIKDGVTLGAHSYITQVKVESWLSGKTDGTAYGNLMATDAAGANEIKVYGLTATSSALSYDATKKLFTFSNPKDFLTNDDTKAIKAGDTLTLVVIRCDYGTTKEIEGVVVDINGKAISNGGTAVAPVTTDAALADVPALGLYSYVVKGKITAWKDAASTDGTKYGNFFIKSDGATGDALYVYGASATGTLAFDATKGALKFTNPQDFLTNDYTKTLAIGSDVTILATRCDYKTTKEINGIVIVPTPTVDPVISDLSIADALKKTADDATVVKMSGIFAETHGTAKYGNGYLVNPTTGDAALIYGCTKTATALVKTDSGKGYYTGAFTNPADFETNGVTVGSYVEMEAVIKVYNGTVEVLGVVTKETLASDAAYTYKYTASKVETTNGSFEVGKVADLAFGEAVTVTPTAATGYKVGSVVVDHGYGKETVVAASGVYSFKANVVNKVSVEFVADVLAGDVVYDVAKNIDTFTTSTNYAAYSAVLAGVTIGTTFGNASKCTSGTAWASKALTVAATCASGATTVVDAYLNITASQVFSKVAIVAQNWNTDTTTVTLEYSTDGTTWTADAMKAISNTSDDATFTATSASTFSVKYARMKVTTTVDTAPTYAKKYRVGVFSVTLTY